MNVADSDALLRALAGRGYAPLAAPDDADLIVVNTCSVREHAEARALTRITELAAIKKRRCGARLWIIGCMAERLGAELARRIDGIDAVIGATQLTDIEAILRKHNNALDHDAPVHIAPGVSEFVPIMRGCDNYCAYCIVPYVRGREQSIPARTLLQQIERRVDAGVCEVTLLGQNVNSYRDNGSDFPDLLNLVTQNNGIKRVRFTTSHPKDCTEKLARTMAANPKICRHLHLPVQSGSNRILALMNRTYTAGLYQSLVAMIRSLIPDADITTDLMVGYPSETEQDFEETLSLVQEIRFTTAFMFAYSAREGTAAARLVDDLPHTLKIERLNRLIRLQTAITKELYQAAVGETKEVMVYDRVKKKNGEFLRAQDQGCKRVLVPCSDVPAGTILTVRTVRSSGMTLVAERI